MRGERISHREFLGSRYDFERHGLIVRGKGDIRNEFFFYSDAPEPINIIPQERFDNGNDAGYAYAFSDTPYGIQMPREELGELFECINDQILGGISSDSVIFRWPTDWTNYFDDGKEWWGSFLWTFSIPGTSLVIVLAASTTD